MSAIWSPENVAPEPIAYLCGKCGQSLTPNEEHTHVDVCPAIDQRLRVDRRIAAALERIAAALEAS